MSSTRRRSRADAEAAPVGEGAAPSSSSSAAECRKARSVSAGNVKVAVKGTSRSEAAAPLGLLSPLLLFRRACGEGESTLLTWSLLFDGRSGGNLAPLARLAATSAWNCWLVVRGAAGVATALPPLLHRSFVEDRRVFRRVFWRWRLVGAAELGVALDVGAGSKSGERPSAADDGRVAAIRIDEIDERSGTPPRLGKATCGLAVKLKQWMMADVRQAPVLGGRFGGAGLVCDQGSRRDRCLPQVPVV